MSSEFVKGIKLAASIVISLRTCIPSNLNIYGLDLLGPLHNDPSEYLVRFMDCANMSSQPVQEAVHAILNYENYEKFEWFKFNADFDYVFISTWKAIVQIILNREKSSFCTKFPNFDFFYLSDFDEEYLEKLESRVSDNSSRLYPNSSSCKKFPVIDVFLKAFASANKWKISPDEAEIYAFLKDSNVIAEVTQIFDRDVCSLLSQTFQASFRQDCPYTTAVTDILQLSKVAEPTKFLSYPGRFLLDTADFKFTPSTLNEVYLPWSDEFGIKCLSGSECSNGRKCLSGSECTLTNSYVAVSRRSLCYRETSTILVILLEKSIPMFEITSTFPFPGYLIEPGDYYAYATDSRF